MANKKLESFPEILAAEQRGELSRRDFLQRAAGAGIGTAAALFLSRAAALASQNATPGASPSASPEATPTGEATVVKLVEIPSNPGSAQPHADPEAVLTLNLGNELDTGDPQVMAYPNEIEVASKVFTPLLALNEKSLPAAAGAESATISGDGKVYTFKIQQGMAYSDGTPVTAKNYAYAIKRALSPVVNGNYSGTLYAVTGGEAWREADPKSDPAALKKLEAVVSESIKALDDSTLQITLDYPAGYFIHVMAIWVTYPVREDLVEGKDVLAWWADPANYIGNGPFKVISHTDKQEWILERNESYFRGSPGIKTLDYKEISSPETQLLAYQQNEFDMVTADATQLPQIQADPTLSQELKRTVAANTFWFSFNVKVKPFDNLNVRQAFAFGINREQYIKQITNGVGIPAGTLLYPGNPAYQTKYQQTYDPDKARQLLADGGFPGGKDFPRQQLRYVADDAASQAWATFFSQNLKDVLGVQIEPTPIDATELQSLRSHRDPSLVFGIGEWWEDYPHPQNWLSLVFGPRAIKFWSDPKFDEMCARADKLPIDQAIPIYQEADAYLAEQAPAAFYLHTENLTLIKPTMQGYVTYPTSVVDTVYQFEKVYKTKS
ncbi:MAG: peptide ABC transporter substrate-binding protein [Thermomicrobiales bacterium]